MVLKKPASAKFPLPAPVGCDQKSAKASAYRQVAYWLDIPRLRHRPRNLLPVCLLLPGALPLPARVLRPRLEKRDRRLGYGAHLPPASAGYRETSLPRQRYFVPGRTGRPPSGRAWQPPSRPLEHSRSLPGQHWYLHWASCHCS